MDTRMIIVEPGATLPKIGETMSATSALYGDGEIFKVKKIKALRWNKRGCLVVEMDAPTVRNKYESGL